MVPSVLRRVLWGAVVLAAVLAGASACAAPPAEAPEPRPARIQIRTVSGVAEFYDTETGARFVPRGHNLVEFRSKTDPVKGPGSFDMVLAPGSYDRDHVRADLEALRALGFNVVRVMLETCAVSDCIGLYPDLDRGLNSAYLDHVADLLALAAETDTYVWLTSNTLPDYGYYLDFAYSGGSEDVSDGQATFLSAQGIEAHRQYVQDLLRALVARDARLDRLFSYAIRNEYWYDLRDLPWSRSSGIATLDTGVGYDMGDADDRRRLAEDGLVRWTNAVTEAVREVLPTALVSIGVFPPDAPHAWRPGDFKLIHTDRLFHEADVDFFDLHPYPSPSGPTLAQFQENFGALGYEAKPLVLGEFGAFTDLYPDVHVAAQAMADWQAASCAFGYDGWLTWHWHGDDLEGLWGSEGTPVGEALAPALHPDPCAPVVVPNPNLAFERPATASAALADEPAAFAVDGTGSQWGSGADAPQWIEIDLGEPVAVGSLRLTVAQFPAGPTVHEVYGGASSPATTLLHAFAAETAEGDVLAHTFTSPPTIRYLRVQTTASPSWVSWREVEAYAP